MKYVRLRFILFLGTKAIELQELKEATNTEKKKRKATENGREKHVWCAQQRNKFIKNERRHRYFDAMIHEMIQFIQRSGIKRKTIWPTKTRLTIFFSFCLLRLWASFVVYYLFDHEYSFEAYNKLHNESVSGQWIWCGRRCDRSYPLPSLIFSVII